ncbi:MAG: hypothetical protein NTW21_15050 [Verrucomicrobia bacterium]|nr:hypothetical protein [Verrucomicrobiota bacterium]
MIRRYNRAQVFHAGIALAGGLPCLLFAYLFFRYLPVFVAWQLGHTLEPGIARIVVIIGLATVAFSGYRTWRTGGGFRGYHESALYHHVGTIDRSNIRLLYIIVGIALMLGSYLWIRALSQPAAGTSAHPQRHDGPGQGTGLAKSRSA